MLYFIFIHFLCLLLGLLCVDYKNFEINRKRKLDWKTQNLRAYFEVPELNKRLNRSTTYVIELTVSSFFWLTITIFMNFDPRISYIRRISITMVPQTTLHWAIFFGKLHQPSSYSYKLIIRFFLLEQMHIHL